MTLSRFHRRIAAIGLGTALIVVGFSSRGRYASAEEGRGGAAGSATPQVDPGGTATSQEKESARIKRLIADLSSSDYRTREDATRQLSTAGLDAVGEIAKAAAAEDLEVAFRSVCILQAMLESDRPGVEAQAATALEQLAAKDSTISDTASDALAGYNVVRQERAIEDLRRLGAEVNVYNTESPAKVGDFLSIVLGARKWRGTPADLARIKQLPNLYEISFYGVKIDEPMAKFLASLENKPSKLNLFGTGISEDNFAIVSATMHSPETLVARRGGAKLGVGGSLDFNTCVVTRVQPGSAAEKAGIQPNDEITSFDGHPVQSFSELTELIARKQSSETAAVEIRRNNETIQKKVSLGQWD